mmetsp:Transcript_3686/g.10852  ORF Transcript_3686/g.10852 Transcript_3686/m.10852 type:complete len:137 (+) Transcript_3686:386-796(+)
MMQGATCYWVFQGAARGFLQINCERAWTRATRTLWVVTLGRRVFFMVGTACVVAIHWVTVKVHASTMAHRRGPKWAPVWPSCVMLATGWSFESKMALFLHETMQEALSNGMPIWGLMNAGSQPLLGLAARLLFVLR